MGREQLDNLRPQDVHDQREDTEELKEHEGTCHHDQHVALVKVVQEVLRKETRDEVRATTHPDDPLAWTRVYSYV